MKLGIVSDVHGNLPALEAVLSAGEELGIGRWLCLGDTVGYYYWPKECVEALRSVGATVIAGNHDRMTVAARSDSALLQELTEKYGHGSEVALRALSDAEINWLHSMPQQRSCDIEGKRVVLCHGSPWDADAYVYPDADEHTRHRMTAKGLDFVAFGHTHYPVCWRVNGTLVVNPGSVGQPRNQQPGAHWAIWDNDTMSVEQRVESYDVSQVLNSCRFYDPELSYLQRVLTRC
jgi:putative phosphoesterase